VKIKLTDGDRRDLKIDAVRHKAIGAAQRAWKGKEWFSTTPSRSIAETRKRAERLSENGKGGPLKSFESIDIDNSKVPERYGLDKRGMKG
jgi:hypothetical protein